MTQKILGPGGSRRRKRFWLVPMLLTVLATVFWVAGAQAVHDTGAFELDGNAASSTSAATPPDDWDRVCHQVTGTNCSTTFNTTGSYLGQTGAKAVSWTSDNLLNGTPSLDASIFTGGGSKDPIDINQWAWKDGAGGLPDKDNLLHSFSARYSMAPSATCPSGGAATCEVLFFGSDRYDNSGDAQQGFWFFQNKIQLGTNNVGGGQGFTGVHANGDLLIISDFSNGGTTSTISVYKWDTTCTAANKPVAACADSNLRTLASSDAAKCTTAGAADAFCGIVNPGTITMPWSFTDKSGTPANGALNGEFYEGGVNLSTLGLGNECFSSVASETRSSTSTTSVLKDFVLSNFGQCNSGLSTVPKDGAGADLPPAGLPIGNGSVSVKDAATLGVTGTAVWTGTLKFFLCGPIATGTCTTGGTQIGATATVTNATVQPILSTAATVTSAGRYCWRSEFASGTSGVPSATESSATECFTVNPVTPAIPTQASGAVAIGAAVSDTANLSGTSNKPGTGGSAPINPTTPGAAAGGTITFRLYGPSATAVCTAANLVFTSAAITVSGNGAYGSGNFTPASAGTYYWVASYTGDAPNTNAAAGACGDSNESVVISPKTPTIVTNAVAGPLPIGSNVSDTATIGNTAPKVNGDPAGGSVTFRLYGPSATAVCTAANLVFTSAAITVSGNGAYGSGNFAPASAGTYYWVASYTGDAPNTTGPVSTACGDANESSVISPKTPTIVTNAVAGPLPIGSNVSDTATIGNTAPKVNGDPAGGSVTFRLYGPSATAVCTAANLVFTSAAITVSGNGAYGSGNFAPASAGTYWWVATYTGDLPNTTGPVSTACGDANESSVISPKTPTIVTNAVAGPLPIGSNVSDTATIGNTAPKVNGDPAGGSVTFRLYGPSATAVCTAANLVFTSAAITVSGNGAYGSGNFAPASAGTYWWVATYTGDLPNTTGPVSTACGDANESSVISPKTPTIVTNAVAGPLPIGSNVSDTATIGNTAPKVNGDPAGGSVTFRLYGPSATAVCTAANLVFTSAAITVSGNGAYGSGNFAPASAGTYWWVATYTGDLPNTTGPVSTACGDANESSVISPKTPTIVTQASPATEVVIGTGISDTATLSGTAPKPNGNPAGGTITFTLYGPDDANCSGIPAYTSGAIPVAGDGPYSSGLPFTPIIAGTYRWVAAYSGDLPNTLAVSGHCGDDNEVNVVLPKTPTIVTHAVAGPVPLGSPISDTATIGNTAVRPNGDPAGGTVTFVAYGPNDPTCTTVAFTSAAIPVSGNDTYPSGNFTPTAAGTYRWIATYTGDLPNTTGPVSTSCNDPDEASVVISLQPTISTEQTFTVKDSATIAVASGAGDLAGSVRFRLYDNATCSGTELYDSGSVPLSGPSPQTVSSGSTTITTSQPTLSWLVEYSNTNPGHNNVTSACNTENASLSIQNG